MPQSGKNWSEELAALPVSRFFSEKTWQTLRFFVETGATAQRGYRLVEFFKALDWIPLAEIEPNPLKLLARPDSQRVHQEIADYFQDKLNKKYTDKVKRENYRLKVFEYYRAHIPSADKALLESLRDYELEKIGQDVNWRHYFWFTSFKQIDAFVEQTPLQRQGIIIQFKHDVEQHYKNAQRMREGTYAQYYWGNGFESAGETFDDWLNRYAQQGDTRQKERPKTRPTYATQSRALLQAYHKLEITPQATLSEIRQQFRKLALQYHPDVPGGSDEKMKQLLDAYDMVKRAHR